MQVLIERRRVNVRCQVASLIVEARLWRVQVSVCDVAGGCFRHLTIPQVLRMNTEEMNPYRYLMYLINIEPQRVPGITA
jgi:hypothetical protein